MTKAYSYLRFSTPEQAKGDSKRRQLELAQGYTTETGLELDDSLTFHDLGISAFRGANKETGRLGEFLAAVDEGLVEKGSFLLVESLDRLSRDSVRRALRTLESIIERGITLVTLSDRKIYTTEIIDNDPMALMWALMVMMRAHEESAIKSRRLKAVNQSKRDKARETKQLLTRRLPAWLRVNEETLAIEAISERANVVLEIFQWANAGLGKEAIARRLNERGEPTFGKAEYWQKSYIQKILENPATIGTMVPRTRDVEAGKVIRKAQEAIEDYFPPVVSEELFRSIETLKKTRAPKGRYAAQSVTNIFAGLTTCSLCGSSFVRVNKGHQTYLVCYRAHSKGGCEYLAQPYGKLEQALRTALPILLNEIPRGGETKHIEDNIESLQEEMWSLHDDLNYLIDDYAKAKSPAIRVKIDELEKQLEEIKAEVERLTRERENQSPELIKQRIQRLEEVIKAEPWVPSEVNRALRENIKQLRIDPPSATVDVQWQTGDWNKESFPFETRHWKPAFDAIE